MRHAISHLCSRWHYYLNTLSCQILPFPLLCHTIPFRTTPQSATPLHTASRPCHIPNHYICFPNKHVQDLFNSCASTTSTHLATSTISHIARIQTLESGDACLHIIMSIAIFAFISLRMPGALKSRQPLRHFRKPGSRRPPFSEDPGPSLRALELPSLRAGQTRPRAIRFIITKQRNKKQQRKRSFS